DDGRAVPKFIRQALSGGTITVSCDGSHTRSIQYIDDHVEGCVRLLHSREAGPVNIGNPCEVATSEAAQAVRDLVGSDSPLEYVPRPEDDPTVRRPDISLARAVLGWEPKVDLADGLRRTIDWFRATLDDPAVVRAV